MGIHPDMRCAIGPKVVLVRSKLATLSRHSLELLLSRGIGISNVHDDRAVDVRLDFVVVKLGDDLVADIARLEPK